jgi:hypothetical protein
MFIRVPFNAHNQTAEGLFTIRCCIPLCANLQEHEIKAKKLELSHLAKYVAFAPENQIFSPPGHLFRWKVEKKFVNEYGIMRHGNTFTFP